MPVDRATFDSDLAATLTAVTNLISAIQAWVNSHTADDFSAEDQQVLTAAQAVADEINALNPPQQVPAPPPAPAG